MPEAATLKQRLAEDVVSALKNGDEGAVALRTLRSVLAEVQRAEKSGKKAVEYTDGQVEEVIARAVKQRRETAEIFATHGKAEASAAELAEAGVLENYLPEPLSSDELDAILRGVIVSTEATSLRDLGKVMQVAKPLIANRVDGKAVSTRVRELLG